MDTDLETDCSGRNSPEPIFQSIINAMGSKKEATADQIYRRIQQDGATNYSKPQVDRALANALQYGIFEVRNNRYRVRDDVLDDEDTIYWQAHIKREKTPYRLENNQREYINPEKDQHTFRKIYVSDGEGCISRKKHSAQGDIARGRKQRVYKQKTSLSTRHMKANGDQIENAPRPKRFTAMERQPIGSRKAVKRLRNEQENYVKKKKKGLRLALMECKNPNHKHYVPESDSDESCKAVKKKRKMSDYDIDYGVDDDDDDDDDDEEEEFDVDDEKEDIDDEEVAVKLQDSRPYSSYFEYMKESYASKFLSKRKNYSSDDMRQADEPSSTGLPRENYENRNWNLGSKHSENLHIGAWCSKVDWLMNRPENTEDGTVKQFDNALEIEPLDSLPFKNMEEPSYIS